MIIHFDFKTPGRDEDADGDKLFTKADYRASEVQGDAAGGAVAASGDEKDIKATFFLQYLEGKSNIVDVTNCTTRLRVTIKDDNLVADFGTFNKHDAHRLVQNSRAIKVIVA